MKSILKPVLKYVRANRRARQVKRLKSHVLGRIAQAEVSFDPFGHTFIPDIFPADFYETVRAHLQKCKSSDQVQNRLQDNPEYINRRFNLLRDPDEVSCFLREVFSDHEVKAALAKKFFLSPTPDFIDQLAIHKEFEYMFTAAGRFQNIHTDIPAKFMSLVFYFPPRPMSDDEELKNATILYDKGLNPAYKARYRPNSVCVFAQHFYSYHGFSTTTERDSLVIFYITQDELDKWRTVSGKETVPYLDIRDRIEEKLTRYPLIEYGADREKLAAEKEQCKINAPNGRILL